MTKNGFKCDETVVVTKYTVSGREFQLSHVLRGKFADLPAVSVPCQ